MQLDRHDEAIAECLEAAKLVERAPNAGTSARLENNLGWSYLQLGDEQQAIQHLTRSAALYNELGSDARGDEVKLLQNLAAYHGRMKRR
jgi:tetratricopeptide (TPR) repeat protein